MFQRDTCTWYIVVDHIILFYFIFYYSLVFSSIQGVYMFLGTGRGAVQCFILPFWVPYEVDHKISLISVEN
jgi:hypothetical protein